jgi:nucleoside-diphosphate-sugar epimerase
MVNVLGSSGFVGSHFCNKFDCISNDRNDLTIKTKEILYLISTTDNYNIYTNPYVDIETNLTTLIRVLENCKNKDVVFNFASSWFVYGQTISPVKEDSICNPKGFYSITKRTAEQLLMSYCQTFNIKYRILRFANVIGTGDKKVSKKKNALTYIIKQLKENEKIQLYNGGNFIRDYIHVDDLCSAIDVVIHKGKLNEIYNIGNGTPLLFSDLIHYAKIKMNSKSEIVSIDESDFHKIVQTKSMFMDCSKLTNLGYVSKHSIFSTIDELIDEVNL